VHASRRTWLSAIPILTLTMTLAFAAVLALVGCGSDKSSGPDDTTPPASIDDLRIQAVGCDNVSLAWTATGDDSTTGRASSYDLRYATETITTANWTAATQCQTEPAPKTAGETESMIVSGLTAGTTYYFAITVRDDEANASEISNNADAGAGSTAIIWVNDGTGADQDWATSTSTLSANWAGACATDYEYALGTSQGGTDIINWTSAGNVTHVTRTDLALSEGVTYYWAVRGVLGAIPGTEVSSNGVTVDTQAPTSSVSVLPATTSSTAFEVAWTGSDVTSGIGRYDIQVKDGDGDWTDWLTSTTLPSSAYTGEIDHTCYFRSRAHDLAGNVETYPTEPDAWTVVTCSYAYSMQWGSQGSGDGEFQYPAEIAIDVTGNLYVADQNNNRVQVFDSEGQYLRPWGGTGSANGEFINAVSVAVDDSGYVYVADFDNGRVQKFLPDGTFITKFGQWGTADGELRYPRGVAVDDSFYVYVADAGNDRIQKFTSNGTFVTTWGSIGHEDGQLYGVMDVAVGPSGTIYAVDCYNQRIQEFTSTGTYLNKWGSYGAGDGEFQAPYCIDIDAAGHVYVTEVNGNRVQKFSASGVFLTKWGSFGTGDGQFDNAKGIALGSGGSVYVTDFHNCRVQKFVPTCP
jgi:hypothetical protein